MSSAPSKKQSREKQRRKRCDEVCTNLNVKDNGILYEKTMKKR